MTTLIRTTATAVLFGLLATALPAQDNMEDHVSEAGGLRVLHAWTVAGDDAPRIYMEIQNESDTDTSLYGARLSNGATAAIQGAPMQAESDSVPLDVMPVPAGQTLDLSPDTQYLQVDAAVERSEGDTLDMELAMSAPEEMNIHVEVLGPDATAHPHAGHQH